ncbi:hypothetical protein JL720_8645 [Aureococcus anophagefferens]|nr:hypothetical protein JL720_8645 [Aureococcus anophagefferens]
MKTFLFLGLGLWPVLRFVLHLFDRKLATTKRVDLRPFERVVLPLWLETFALNESRGEFRFRPAQQFGSLYGVVDAAHLLASVGRLGDLTDARRDAWKAEIDSYQVDAATTPVVGAPGWQPWHSSASAAAALALLDRRPGAPTDRCQQLAAGGAEAWRAEMDPLYDDACYSDKLGGNNIHRCGQRIGSCAAILGYADASQPFLAWWRNWLVEKTDAATGVLCPAHIPRIQCVGGAMPTRGVELGFSNASQPFAREVLDLTLGLQASQGAWTLELSAKRLNDARFVMANFGATSHDLPNVVAAAAECARAFPADVKTDRPWTCCARYG